MMKDTLTLENVASESDFLRNTVLEDPDPKWRKVVDELLAARDLEDDWDGQGAKAPSIEVVDTSLVLVQKLRTAGFAPPNDFGPSVNGAMTLAWRSDTSSMEIEVLSSTRIEGYRWRKGDDRAEQFAL